MIQLPDYTITKSALDEYPTLRVLCEGWDATPSDSIGGCYSDFDCFGNSKSE